MLIGAVVLAAELAVWVGCDRAEESARAASLEARDDVRDRAAYDRQRRPDRLIAALGLRPGDRVADIGAGRGYLEPYLAAAIGSRGRLVAADVDPAALAALDRMAADRGIEVETRLVDAGDPELEAGAYDLLLLARVDHLLADRADYLRRLRPALAAGGRIAISNRIDREPAVRAAADAAGLRVVAASRELPAQFVLILEPDLREARQ